MSYDVLLKHLQGQHDQHTHAGGRGGGSGISAEAITPPPPGKSFSPDVEADKDGDKVTDAARVGVGAFDVPPPPPIGRLPNLTDDERQVEGDFIKAYESDPDGVAQNFLDIVNKTTKPGEPPTFGTDDAKVLSDKWSDPSLSLEERSQNRAIYNTALHQTANAITKRAFLKHLDTLKPGDEVLITNGGCGAGKGFALKNVPEALDAKQKSKAVWDSAGDQNSTENPWLQQELEKRGLKGNYIYVHADPKVQWADPGRGVVQRAGNPKDGRMVDAKVFGDSYGLGAKNHQAFFNANKANPNASFTFLDNTSSPKLLSGMPKSALDVNSGELTRYAIESIMNLDVPAHVRRGALMGDRIWED